MEKAGLIKYLSSKEPLTEETLSQLSRLKADFPYFQTAHLLALKNKFILGKDDWKEDVDPVSAYVPDRRVIYDLLYPLELNDTGIEDQQENPVTEESIQHTEPAEPVNLVIEQEQVELINSHEQVHAVENARPIETASPTLRENISNLLSFQLGELELVDPSEAELVPEIGIDFDKTYGAQTGENDLLVLDTTQEIQTSDTEDQSVDKKELIDKFIESSPRLIPRTEDKPQVDISEDSVKEHDGIFTDTLAKIYVKQGYYSKAIFAYEKLILKYPEKSDYFAVQIEEIKKLTNKQ
ncbi:MAG TPA: tetratricopeptide repeat protein [Bacteroidales bacterium]|jgi:tetratricopeptide (TPR) repeat protein|nr:tetratricopeptide repeat protein [Bacteroidales bacterium]